MTESIAARIAAARFICGLKGITPDRIDTDNSGRLFVDYELMDQSMRNRVGVLTVIILDCVGGDTDQDISNRIGEHQAHSADTRWVAKHLRNGEIIGIVEDFLSLRGASA
ncbi:hypothetical protein ACFMPD_13030 [Sedimentitalea sp. HM32M-2]|uniref:hypothetical protein n=1 Tax=Sedimentitalea sp. HM32M-2 TaxID=3351566 RepID=UPI0036423F24